MKKKPIYDVYKLKTTNEHLFQAFTKGKKNQANTRVTTQVWKLQFWHVGNNFNQFNIYWYKNIILMCFKYDMHEQSI